ncbi:MAG: hypothetical protein KQH63_07615 [Desulfobulbaceae bacterium]|nr:hypothetical protein [Desulfobulbaceae bacterium]
MVRLRCGKIKFFAGSAILFLIGPLLFLSVALAEDEKKGLADNEHPRSAKTEKSNRSVTKHTLQSKRGMIEYVAVADSMKISGKEEKPIGDIFYTSYTVNTNTEEQRPLTFVFNGGPGAASAYLHLGALGPVRIVFNDDGTVPRPPARLETNTSSWLFFTDLVFVDPIGTGYSRIFEHETYHNNPPSDISQKQHFSVPDSPNAWGVAEDGRILAEFIRLYLTREQRWLSPLFLAGESYGGFRIARLSRLLQAEFGIGLNGLILISPALDFSLLWGNDQSLLPWAVLLPSYSAVAAFHKNTDNDVVQNGNPRSGVLHVEKFALSDFLSGLAGGQIDREDWFKKLEDITGIPKKTIKVWQGRIPPIKFVKTLLEKDRRLLSLYDGSVTVIDSDPSSEILRDGDPYLEQLNVPVTTAFNSYIRKTLGYKSDRPYLLLNDEVFGSWNWRSGIHGKQGYANAVDHLQKTISLNPEIRVLIMHGIFDLVTPYFASVTIVNQLDLDPQLRNNITIKTYSGGHMPYLNKHSRDSMYLDALQFFTSGPDKSRTVD